MKLTEEVFNYAVMEPIKQTLSKDYSEYYVLAVLKQYFPQIGEALHKAEAPDLQDEQGAIGIEVTRAISNDEAQISGEYLKLNNPDNTNKELSKKIISQRGGELTDKGVFFPLGTTTGVEINIRKAIKSKTKKASKYRKCQQLGLAIILDLNAFHDIRENWVNWINEEQEILSSKYELFFLICWDSVQYYNSNTKEIICVELDKELKTGLKKLARMTAEEIIDEDNAIWK